MRSLPLLNMWLLTQTSSSSSNEGVCLLPNVQYVVGRKDCPILIENDPSISRKHAVITISHSEENLKNADKAPEVSLQDTSKYGISVNGSKITGIVQLKSGDQILFGSRDSCYRLTYSPLVVVTSCLDNNKKKVLKSTLLKLGGHILDEWKPDCITYLVMDGLTFTIKVVHALAQGCHIVTPAFFEELVKAVDSKTPLPSAKRFLPPTKEASLKSEEVSFEPVQARRSLLKGKSVIFLSKKQYRRVHMAVKLSGGTSILRQPPDILAEDELTSDGTLVIMMDSKELSTVPVQMQHWVAQVVDTLRKCNLRTVPESELGLALLHSSLEKYCNPSMDAVPALTQSLVSQSLHAADMLSQQIQLQAPAAFCQQFKKPSAPMSKGADKESCDNRRPAVERDSFPSLVPETQSQSFNEGTPAKRRKVDDNEVVQVADTPDRPKSSNKRAFECVVQESELDSRSFTLDTQQNESMLVDKLQSSKSDISMRSDPIPDGLEIDSASRDPPSKRSKTCCEYLSAEKSSDERKRKSNQQKQDEENTWLSVSSVTAGKGDVAAASSEEKSDEGSKDKNKTSSEIHVRDEDMSRTKRQNVSARSGAAQNSDKVTRDRYKRIDDAARSTRQEVVLDIDVPEGFLCARVPRKITDDRADSSLHEAEEDNLPRNLVIVDHVTLVVRRAPVTVPTNNAPSAVKNFKRFRKQWYPGSGGALPRIIGGSDLTVHQATKPHDAEEWFLEAQQVEAEQTRQDRIAEDLFRWEDSNTARSRRTRR